MAADAHPPEQSLYRIEVDGRLDDRWSEWFSGLAVATCAGEPPRSTLTGRVDQTALRGILNRLWDLNLALISVRRLPTPPRSGASPQNQGAST